MRASDADQRVRHEIYRLTVDDVDVQRAALAYVVEFTTSRAKQDLVHENGGIDALMRLVVYGQTPDLRATAMRALGLVGAKNCKNKASTRPILAWIVRLVREGSLQEKAEAIWALRILTYEDDTSIVAIRCHGAKRALEEAAAIDDLHPFYKRAAAFVVRSLSGEFVPRYDDEDANCTLEEAPPALSDE